MKTKIIKNSALSSAIVAVLVTIFAFGAINPAFAYDVRDDTLTIYDTYVGDTGSAYVSVKLIGYYPAEWPPIFHDHYECAFYEAKKVITGTGLQFHENLWVWFYADGYSQPQHNYTSNHETLWLGCAGADWVVGYGGAFCYDESTQQYEWLQASNMLQAWKPE